jgi:hypothetical protein
MNKQSLMYNIPIAVFFLNTFIFLMSILLMDDQFNIIFLSDLTLTLLTLVLSIGSVAFLLGLYSATKTTVPIIKKQMEDQVGFEEVDVDNYNFSQQPSLENFSFALNLIEDVDGHVDGMSVGQLQMTGEKLKQLFIEAQAVETLEIQQIEEEFDAEDDTTSEVENDDTEEEVPTTEQPPDVESQMDDTIEESEQTNEENSVSVENNQEEGEDNGN